MPLMLVNAQFAFADSLKIGVVDVQQILMLAPQVEAINTRLRQEYEPRNQEMMDLNESLEQDQERLDRDQPTMSRVEITQLENGIRMAQRQLERKQEDYDQDLNLKQNQEMGQLVEQIRNKISEIAKNEHFDLILQKDALPYASDQLDITQQVIDQLSEGDNDG